MKRLQECVAVVAGGASGVGPRICRGLAKGGARIAILDGDAASAVAVATRLDPDGTTVTVVSCDLGNYADLMRAAQEAVDWFGRIDLLVDNVHEVRFDGSSRSVAVACLPHMVAGGHVVDVTSDRRRQCSRIRSHGNGGGTGWPTDTIVALAFSVACLGHPSRIRRHWTIVDPQMTSVRRPLPGRKT